jgi:hypothetical protein
MSCGVPVDIEDDLLGVEEEVVDDEGVLARDGIGIRGWRCGSAKRFDDLIV